MPGLKLGQCSEFIQCLVTVGSETGSSSGLLKNCHSSQVFSSKIGGERNQQGSGRLGRKTLNELTVKFV